MLISDIIKLNICPNCKQNLPPHIFYINKNEGKCKCNLRMSRYENFAFYFALDQNWLCIAKALKDKDKFYVFIRPHKEILLTIEDQDFWTIYNQLSQNLGFI